MIDRQIEIGRCCLLEMNAEKGKKKKKNVMRISRQPSRIQIVIFQRQRGSVECFTYLGSMIQDGHVKLNPGLPWQKHHSTRRRIFTGKLD
jgi:hypothetical protein